MEEAEGTALEPQGAQVGPIWVGGRGRGRLA
jgi:hypothetical protein